MVASPGEIVVIVVIAIITVLILWWYTGTDCYKRSLIARQVDMEAYLQEEERKKQTLRDKMEENW